MFIDLGYGLILSIVKQFNDLQTKNLELALILFYLIVILILGFRLEWLYF